MFNEHAFHVEMNVKQSTNSLSQVFGDVGHSLNGESLVCQAKHNATSVVEHL